VSYPPALLKSILEDAEPAVVCTKAQFSEHLTGCSAVPVLLDTDWLDRVREENSQLAPFTDPVHVSLDDMAYIVYSSGTTGKPKGKGKVDWHGGSMPDFYSVGHISSLVWGILSSLRFLMQDFQF
jgi:arthrofactin-type cyclic lipopeptide synthetase C